MDSVKGPLCGQLLLLAIWTLECCVLHTKPNQLHRQCPQTVAANQSGKRENGSLASYCVPGFSARCQSSLEGVL